MSTPAPSFFSGFLFLFLHSFVKERILGPKESIPSMKIKTLKFRSFNDLWEFKQLTNTNNFKIDTNTLTITAEFSEAQMELAVQSFEGVLVLDKAA